MLGIRRLVAGAGVGLILAACSPAPWGKATVTEVRGDTTCVYDSNWKNVCVPSGDFAEVGGVAVGDCLELKVAREAAEIKGVRRSSGCPPVPEGSTPTTPPGSALP